MGPVGPISLRLLSSRFTTLVSVLLAGWPVLRWYGLRLFDGGDEPLGLLALLAALVFAPRRGWLEPLPKGRLLGLSLTLLVYSASYYLAPPILRAALWVTGVALCAAPRRAAFAWWTLAALSLPWVSTLQFYLGYPLRCLTTLGAAALLRLGGVAVVPEGTALDWAGERVLVDAPCSGIQMAWTLLVISAALASARGLDARGTLGLFRRAGVLVLLGNMVRAAALFCLEMRFWPVPATPRAHDVAGLLVFGAVVWLAVCRRERSSA